MAYRAIDIAKIIVNDAIDIGHPITNLKLQKLLYYVQAAFLVEYNTPCFDDDIVAWKYGPVVERVYNDFRIYGSNIINNRITQLRTAEFNGERIVFKTVDIDSLNIPEKDATLILSIVNKFSTYTAWQMVELTHKETPWADTKIGDTISNDKIRTYFKNQLNRGKLYGTSNR